MRFTRITYTILGLPAIMLCMVGAYLPFVDSPAVFDDFYAITQFGAYDYALNFFSTTPRVFPYFTIGFFHVLSDGDLVWNRWFGIGLHALVLVALYRFMLRALRMAAGSTGAEAKAALLVCAWVALNPVSVYAHGYLIQRTIVMATLFMLVSATLYLRAQESGRNADIVSAALTGVLAMFCKEHAVMTPVAVVLLTPLVCHWNRASLRRAVAYFLLCLPAMGWIVSLRGRSFVGSSYEIYAGQVMSQFSLPSPFDFSGGEWAMSIATQLLCFWRYLFLWFVPNPQWLSADLRIDFSSQWTGAGGWLALLASVAVLTGAAVIYCRRQGRGAAGAGAAALLFAAVPFVVELSAVRVQEPFVLYRSYLWMPAYALLMGLLLVYADGRLSSGCVGFKHGFWAVLILACAVLFPLAQDRLRSFGSENNLWMDAEAKLPRPDVAGADRIYYNLANEAGKQRNYERALELSQRVIRQNPQASHGYMALGTSLMALKRLDEAYEAYEIALAHNPPDAFRGYLRFKQCGVLEAQGKKTAVIACLKESVSMGYERAGVFLQLMGIE